jgi:hypothetical protein
MHGKHLVKHYNRTQKVVTLSSAEAELGGVVQGASEGLGTQSIARDLGITATLTLWADSSAAIGICQRSGIGRVRHLAVGQLWVQERVRDKTLRLKKVAGEANPADVGTKHLGAEVMRRCMVLTGLVPRDGRSSASPALTAQVQPFLSEAAPSGAAPPRPKPAVRALRSLQGPFQQRTPAAPGRSSEGASEDRQVASGGTDADELPGGSSPPGPQQLPQGPSGAPGSARQKWSGPSPPVGLVGATNSPEVGPARLRRRGAPRGAPRGALRGAPRGAPRRPCGSRSLGSGCVGPSEGPTLFSSVFRGLHKPARSVQTKFCLRQRAQSFLGLFVASTMNISESTAAFFMSSHRGGVV